MTALLPLLAGLGTGLALIVAIGVQNTYLLRLAVSAPVRVVTAAVVVCAVSDAVLILAGVLGVGVVVERFPVALVVVRFVGAAFLVVYGLLAARRALRPSGDAMRVDRTADDDGVPGAVPRSATDGPGPAEAIAPRHAGRAQAQRGATSVTGCDVGAERDTAAQHHAAERDAAVQRDTATQRDDVATQHADAATQHADVATQRDGVAAQHDAAGATTAVDSTTGVATAAGRTRTAPPGRSEPAGRTATPVPVVPTMRAAVLTMLVFTWANPHVYLDTLVFLGSVANQQGPDDRWLWTIGAVAASCVWFSALGFGGRLLRPLFAKPLTWRVFDGLVAVVMLGFGVLLLVGA